MAAASGMTNSVVASATYIIIQQQQVATPTFSPGGGTYTGSVTVSISEATSGATIYYTTDGSTPAVYTRSEERREGTTLQPMAAASGMTNSVVASATYISLHRRAHLHADDHAAGHGGGERDDQQRGGQRHLYHPTAAASGHAHLQPGWGDLHRVSDGEHQ